MTQPVLYVIACAAPPARHADRLVKLAQEQCWDACVLTTPSGRRFADVAGLEELTGHPVRSEYKDPGEPDVLPPPDAIIFPGRGRFRSRRVSSVRSGAGRSAA
jgi:hypothetical protein